MRKVTCYLEAKPHLFTMTEIKETSNGATKLWLTDLTFGQVFKAIKDGWRLE